MAAGLCVSWSQVLFLAPDPSPSSQPWPPILALNLYLLALAHSLCLPALAPNLYILALALNLYLPALAPNLYLRALTIYLHLPALAPYLDLPDLSKNNLFTGPAL